MANHPSALKRARQNETRKLRNRTVKTRVKNIDDRKGQWFLYRELEEN